jgi:hypothetical protein
MRQFSYGYEKKESSFYVCSCNDCWRAIGPATISREMGINCTRTMVTRDMYVYSKEPCVRHTVRLYTPNTETTRFLRNNPDLRAHNWYLFQVQWSTWYEPRAADCIPIIHIQLYIFISSDFSNSGEGCFVEILRDRASPTTPRENFRGRRARRILRSLRVFLLPLVAS